MMVAKRDDWMSVEDFLALDRENLDQKYEFVDGKMIAMAGGTVKMLFFPLLSLSESLENGIHHNGRSHVLGFWLPLDSDIEGDIRMRLRIAGVGGFKRVFQASISPVVFCRFSAEPEDFKSLLYMIWLLRLLCIHSSVFSTGDFARASKMSLAEHKFRRHPKVSTSSTSPFMQRESCSYIRDGRFFFFGLTSLIWQSCYIVQ